MDVAVVRVGELRQQAFAYVFEVLAVLSLAHIEHTAEVRIISFRKASIDERERYHDWLENDFEN